MNVVCKTHLKRLAAIASVPSKLQANTDNANMTNSITAGPIMKEVGPDLQEDLFVLLVERSANKTAILP